MKFLSSVKDCINYFKRSEYKNLFDDECYRRLNNVLKQYGNLETHETILEVCLSNDDRTCDYSIRLDKKSKFGKEFWLELDFDACKDNDIKSCSFFDVLGINNLNDIEIACDEVLPEIVSKEIINKLKSMLIKFADIIFSKNIKLYQIGSMSSRGQNNSLRIFVNDSRREKIIEYLNELNWSGDLNRLNDLLTELEIFSEGHKFIIDFDLFEDHISEKIGINFGTINKSTQTIKTLLDFLQEKNLCNEDKKSDVLKFVDEFPQYDPYIQNDISHFKLAFINGQVDKAKVYLRQGDDFYQHDFRAYASPVLMNLELTTKCPLNCPQCYCDLSTGKDMDRKVALYWIYQAAANNVKVVNLSGGETLCYPHLWELVETCSKLNMEANIALSGYKADKKILNELIKKGVADICISLNGSTKDINDKSRDGYDLAIQALENLKELNYNRTCINWVMHSFNADDFENVAALAEFYNVKSIAIMMFKPDKSHSLPSVPSKEQILKINKFIRNYKGKVILEIEECFSQLRAVNGERFFFNHNIGLSRGCGAGRDGFSISVDGYFTPCRHLYTMKEKFSTIADYWSNSSILKELRTTEDRIDKPCSECKYKRNCLPCMAVVWNFNHRLRIPKPSALSPQP